MAANDRKIAYRAIGAIGGGPDIADARNRKWIFAAQDQNAAEVPIMTETVLINSAGKRPKSSGLHPDPHVCVLG
jgi:hypothetical protein